MKKILLSFCSVLVLLLGFGLVFADTNGIWTDAKDVKPGIFGNDEEDGDFIFTNSVFINTNSDRGLSVNSTSNDGIVSTTSIAGKSAIYGSTNNPSAYSGYFQGGKFVVGTGNVGIGTTTPGYKLEVNGDIYANNGWVRTSGSKGWYSESYGGGWFMSDPTWIRSYNSKSVWTDTGLLGTNGGITSGYSGSAPSSGGAIIAGNVGIGTTSPQAKLDVNGNALVNYLSINPQDSVNEGGELQLKGAGSYNNFQIDNYQGNARIHTLASNKYFQVVGGGALIAGNVGIGTTNPGYKLEVNGDIYANNGWVRTSGSKGWYSESYGGGWYMTDPTWIRSYNSKSVWTDTGLLGTNGGITSGYSGSAPPSGGAIISGNVGIGTTSPSSKLDLNGNLRIRGKSNCPGKLYTDSSGNVLCGVDKVGITSESDPTVPASIKDGISWNEISGKPSGFADGIDNVGITSESDPTVPANIKDGISWNEISGKPSGFADGIDNVGSDTYCTFGAESAFSACDAPAQSDCTGGTVWGVQYKTRTIYCPTGSFSVITSVKICSKYYFDGCT